MPRYNGHDEGCACHGCLTRRAEAVVRERGSLVIGGSSARRALHDPVRGDAVWNAMYQQTPSSPRRQHQGVFDRISNECHQTVLSRHQHRLGLKETSFEVKHEPWNHRTLMYLAVTTADNRRLVNERPLYDIDLWPINDSASERAERICYEVQRLWDEMLHAIVHGVAVEPPYSSVVNGAWAQSTSTPAEDIRAAVQRMQEPAMPLPGNESFADWFNRYSPGSIAEATVTPIPKKPEPKPPSRDGRRIVMTKQGAGECGSS